jgi:hypothetical protein
VKFYEGGLNFEFAVKLEFQEIYQLLIEASKLNDKAKQANES